MTPDFCIFCLATRADVALGAPIAFYWTPNAPPHAADRCTYNGAHEFPAMSVAAVEPPTKKRDPKLCIKCSLHPKNPEASRNACEHVFEA